MFSFCQFYLSGRNLRKFLFSSAFICSHSISLNGREKKKKRTREEKYEITKCYSFAWSETANESRKKTSAKLKWIIHRVYTIAKLFIVSFFHSYEPSTPRPRWETRKIAMTYEQSTFRLQRLMWNKTPDEYIVFAGKREMNFVAVHFGSVSQRLDADRTRGNTQHLKMENGKWTLFRCSQLIA